VHYFTFTYNHIHSCTATTELKYGSKFSEICATRWLLWHSILHNLRLGLHPGPHWGSLRCSSRSLTPSSFPLLVQRTGSHLFSHGAPSAWQAQGPKHVKTALALTMPVWWDIWSGLVAMPPQSTAAVSYYGSSQDTLRSQSPLDSFRSSDAI